MKNRHNFGYFFREGLSNMFTHGFMSFASVGVTVACLLIMGTFSLVALNADALLKDLEQDNEILAFVDESLSEAQARNLESEILAIPNVTGARFISREEAGKAYSEQYADEEMFQDLDPAIFRHRFAIQVSDLALVGETAAAIRQVENIADINAFEDVANGFVAVRNIASVVCVALIAILFIVSMFIISNTIKLTTFDRREEIAIMKMVGATNGFIRWPFVYEGLLIGVLSAGIAFGLQWLLYAAMVQGVNNSSALQLVTLMEFGTIWLPVAGIFALAGILVGVCGSLSAIRKFLRV
ncbi:MAG: permease-like cell division protein FtsX [Oscillospiraceae bacterium]|nr:permease-like cell division protein FtsX [Oscillospiraceae bacterium]